MGESVLIANSVIQLTIRTWTNLAWKTPGSAIIRHVKSGSETGLGKAGGFGERGREGGRRRQHTSVTLLGKGRRRRYTWPRALPVSGELRGEGAPEPPLSPETPA